MLNYMSTITLISFLILVVTFLYYCTVYVQLMKYLVLPDELPRGDKTKYHHLIQVQVQKYSFKVRTAEIIMAVSLIMYITSLLLS